MSDRDSTIEEHFGQFAGADRAWDVAFWQRQGPEAIFDAVWGMILDHHFLTQSNAPEPRLQKFVEKYGRS